MAAIDGPKKGEAGVPPGGQEIPDSRRVPLGPRTLRAVRLAQAASFWFARHWLALANGINLLILATAAAVPIMMMAGLNWLAGPVFASYRLICHQLPERSFFLFGYQMAFCERDVATYGAMALAGLVMAANRGRLRPLPWLWLVVATIPLGVDGLTQLVELRESSWQLRILTGSLFGGAVVWAAYPRLDRFAAEILSEESRRRGLVAALGRGDAGTR